MCHWYTKQLHKISIFFLLLLATHVYLSVTNQTVFEHAHASVEYSVCASGCNFATLTEAFASSTVVAGDVLAVQSGYSTAAETFPLTIPNSLIVDCQLSTATIGRSSGSQVTINLSNGTLRNCNLSDVVVAIANASSTTVSGNTFTTSTASDIAINDSRGVTFSNNLYANSISLIMSSSTTVTGNTFYNYTALASSNEVFYEYKSTNNTISNNTFTDFSDSYGGSLILFSYTTSTIFTGNTINRGSTSIAVPNSILTLSNVYDASVSSNYFDVANHTTTSDKIIISLSAQEQDGSFTILHNTFITKKAVILRVADEGFNVTLDARYNIFYSPTQDSTAIQFNKSSATPTYTVTLGYNDYYQGSDAISNRTAFTSYSTGATDVFIEPAFKIDDDVSNNDLQLVPYSGLFDVNDAEDIGAESGTHDATIRLDAAGTIDYSTVDATNTSKIATNLRTGDTVIFAAGTYTGFTASSTYLLSGNLTLRGVSQNTYLNALSGQDALFLKGVSSNSVRDIIFRNASTSATTYTITKPIFTYNGASYNDAASVGASAGSAFILSSASVCSTDPYQSDGFNATSYINGTDDVHLALVDAGGAKLVVFIPNQYSSDPDEVETLCAGNSVQVDRWATSTFSVSGGVYTYNAAAVAAAGVTLNSGFTDPPALTRTVSVSGGIKLHDSSNNSFTAVTSSYNSAGVYFSGTSDSNIIAESTIASSTVYEVYSDGSGTLNRLKNVSYNTDSAYVEGSGNVRVLYKGRVAVTNSSGTAIAGAAVTLQSASGVVGEDATSASLTTGEDGVTSFSSYLLAYILSSDSVATTAGGYNPYSVSVASTSGLSAYSGSQALITPHQSISAVMTAASSGGNASPRVSGGWHNNSQSSGSSDSGSVATSNSEGTAATAPTTDESSASSQPIQNVTPSTNVPSTGESSKSETGELTAVPAENNREVAPAPDEKSASAPAYAFKNFLGYGNVGVDVRYLQAVLKNLGFFKYPAITGRFLTVTRSAVASFQRANRLTPVGWMGPRTREALNNAILKNPALIEGALPKN